MRMPSFFAVKLLTCVLVVPNLQVQKSWMYLEPIFSAQDIQKQLPAEHKAFDQVHRQLREIMRRTKDRPNALQITSNAGLCVGCYPGGPECCCSCAFYGCRRLSTTEPAAAAQQTLPDLSI